MEPHDPEAERNQEVVQHDPEDTEEESKLTQESQGSINTPEETSPTMKSPPQKKMRRRNPTKKITSSSRMPKMPKMTAMKKKNDRSPQKTTTPAMEDIEKKAEEERERIRESDSTLPTDLKELGGVLHDPEDQVEVHQDPEASGRPSKAPERAGDNSPKKTSPGGYILQANQPGTLSQLLQDPEAGGEVQQDPEAIRRLTMTPERAWSNQIKKRLFTIGRDTNKEDVYVGKVIQAKMTIEERMKKEMRDKKLEEVRRRVIQTPKTKRDRREDGVWDEATTEPGMTSDSNSRSQEGSRSNRKLQTPLTSFLIPQTLAERRASIQKRSNQVQKEADI